jgi:hypothetical protein
MGMIADLFVKLGLKSDEFNKGVDDAKKKTSSFESSLKSIGGAMVAAFSVGAIISFGKAAMEEFNRAEQGATRLLIALKGNVIAQEDLMRQATALQKTTLFEDDETIAAQASMAMLIKEADVIKKLTPLVQDLATAKGIDLTSAASMVSKAVMGSGAALQKMGIQTEGTAGSAQRLESVMRGLNAAVGGQAEAAAKVGTGALTQFANAFGNLKEAIGGIIVQSSMVQGSLVQTTTSATNYLTEKLGRVKEVMAASGFGFFNSMALMALKSKEHIDKLLESKKKFDAEHAKPIAAGAKMKTPEEIAEEEAKLAAQKKAADDAEIARKSAIVDQLILARIEQQKIIELQGGKVEGSLSPKGGGKVGWNEDLKLSKGKVDVLDPLAKATEGLTAAKLEKNIVPEITKFNEDINSLIAAGMQDAAMTFGEGLGALMSGDMNVGEFGLSLLATVGNFIVQFGQLMIAQAVAMAALQLSIKNPALWPVALAAGIALVAVGSAISNMSKKGLTGSGGGGGGGGSSAASGYNGKQSQSTAQTAMSGNVSFEVQGNKLVGVLANQGNRNNNFK